MSWLNGLSKEEVAEILLDNCNAYSTGVIGSVEFTMCLVKLGYNATDIAELEQQYRPPASEDDEED
jgi:hypothetical protein